MKCLYSLLLLLVFTPKTYADYGDPDTTLAPFFHGVASGDPLENQVILWTKVSPENAPDSVKVVWQIALDTLFENIAGMGITYTKADRDYTIKIDATNLQPGTYYYYRFYSLGNYSLIGRTKTVPTGEVDHLRFAVVSCSNYAAGYFNAYQQITARNDVDAVFHLGDYIYEHASTGITPDRNHVPPHEAVTLADYRLRHGRQKLDPDLLRLHQQVPFITIWDDHESANNSWYGGASSHQPATEGDWFVRKSAAIQAYFEWMPIRPPDVMDEQRIYRSVKYGNLAELFFLDTRLEERDEQAPAIGDPDIDNPDRKLLGDAQMTWLTESMNNSTAQWKVIAQQVVMAHVGVNGVGLNPDQWDGYTAERNFLFNYIMTENIENVVVLTGDIHSSWANDLPQDLATYNAFTGAGSVGVEFVATSVTSNSFDSPVGTNIIQLFNPHVKYVDLLQKGFIILDIDSNRTQADWNYVPDVLTINHSSSVGASYLVNAGERHLTAASAPLADLAVLQPQAPLLPPSSDIRLQVKVFLEGAYDATLNGMTTHLQTGNLLLLAQPFNRPPWNYQGTESVPDAASFPANIVDWVLVELRDTADNSLVVTSKAAYLLANGAITDHPQRQSLSFENIAPCTAYYLVVRSRNHLATMSATPLLLPTFQPYDFTLAAEQAWGNQQQTEVALGVFAQFAGDFDSGGTITVADFNLYSSQSSVLNQYVNGDANLDRNVTVTDFNLYQPNSSVIGVQQVRY